MTLNNWTVQDFESLNMEIAGFNAFSVLEAHKKDYPAQAGE